MEIIIFGLILTEGTFSLLMMYQIEYLLEEYTHVELQMGVQSHNPQ